MVFKYIIFFLVCVITPIFPSDDTLYSSTGRPLAPSIDYFLNAKKNRGKCALLVTSDRGRKNTGVWAKNTLEEHGYEVLALEVIPNEEDQVNAFLKRWISNQVDVIFTLGGTGFSKRDTTVDVVEKWILKPMPGFGELFRRLTHEDWKKKREEIPDMSLLTRTSAGMHGDCFLFALPGSLDAVKLGFEIILPTLPHLLGQRTKDHKEP